MCVKYLSNSMYTLKDAWKAWSYEWPTPEWDGRFVCVEATGQMFLDINATRGLVSCFSLDFITQGNLRIDYNGIVQLVEAGTFFAYSPGQEIRILEVSDDFYARCLVVEESYMFTVPVAGLLIASSNIPFSWLNHPQQRMPADVMNHLLRRLEDLLQCQQSAHSYKAEALQALYSIFMIDLFDFEKKTDVKSIATNRSEHLFMDFFRLLPSHFREHHDIAFYASELCVSPVYLSRIVRQVSGRTVGTYINRFLTMEACYLLCMSEQSIAQIAEQLHFCDASSFCNYFTRRIGTTPKQYRKTKKFSPANS